MSAVTGLTEVTNQIQKYWSPMFTKKLRESLMLGSVVDKSYEGQILNGGDTVRVSQVENLTGQLLTVGTNADSFNTEALSTVYVDIVANKRAVAAIEFQDLVQLQSQISAEDSNVKDTLMFAMQKQINDYLYSLVSPSTSAPDHLISGVTDFNAAQLKAVRTLAAQAKWPVGKPWMLFCDPVYYSDLLNDSVIVSSDFGASDAPAVGGKIGLARFGFNVFEDNSRGSDYALAFHSDFMHLVTQKQVQVKISDMHSQGKFGFKLSVDLIFGAKLSNDGGLKHIKIYNT